MTKKQKPPPPLEPRLPAIYAGKPPIHAYGSDEELMHLVALRSLAESMAQELHTVLTTFGPKPDIEIAFLQEDCERMARTLQARIYEHFPNTRGSV